MMLLNIQLSPLELLLDILVKEYLVTSYCISIVSEIPLNFNSPVSFTYTIPDDENLVNQILDVSEMGCSDYVVLMRQPQKFMTAFDKVVHIGMVRRSDRKIIILPHDDHMNEVNSTLDLLTLKESGFVANMLVVAYSDKSDQECAVFNLITHTFVGSDRNVKLPLYLNSWNSCDKKFDNHVNLFPHDMTNMYGKVFKVAVFTYQPYAMLDIDTSVNHLGRDGVEVRIVDEFCRWINCTIVIVNEDSAQWGKVYENETDGIGVIGSVVADRADVGIPALYSWYEEWRVLDFSISGVRTAITCVAPAPRLLSSWKMPLMAFTWNMWAAVIFTFFYVSIALVIAEGCKTESSFFLAVLGIIIGQSHLESKKSWKVRSVTGWVIIVGLILGSAYGAGLAATLTVPMYDPSIDTVQDIVNRGMEWGATHDAWIYSLTLSTEPLIKKLVSQFRIYSFEELQRKSLTRNMAFSVEKLPAGNFAIGGYLSKDVLLNMMLMVEDFYYEQCVLMMRKSSPYTEKVSELIGRLHQSGLLLAWETQVAVKHLDYKVQLEVRLSRSKIIDSVTKALSASDVVGIFMMYLTGVIISMITFCGELLWQQRRT